MSLSNVYATDLNGTKFISVPKISVGKDGVELRNDLGAGDLTVNSTGTQLFFNGVQVQTGGVVPVWVGTATSDLDMSNYDIDNANDTETKTITLRDFNTGIPDGTGIAYKVGEVVINQNTSVQGALSTEQVKVYDNPSGTFIELSYDKANETLDINNNVSITGDVDATTVSIGTSTISQVVAGPINVSGSGGLQSSKIIADGGVNEGVFIGTYPSDTVQLSYDTTTDVMEINRDTNVIGDLSATNLTATTNVGASTVNATTSVSAPVVVATDVALKDNLNLYTQLAKSSNQKFIAYGNTLGGAPDTAVLDDINNKPTIALASNILSLNAKDVLGNPVQLSTVDLTSAFTSEYIPLTGTLPSAPVVGSVVFQTGSSNLQCDDIQTSLITANAPFNFISVESPLQTKLLGVRSEDGVSDPKILMAMSEASIAPNILSMEYDITAQVLKVNKGISAIDGDITAEGDFLTTDGDFQTENGNLRTINGDVEANNGNISGDVLNAITSLSVGTSGITNNGNLETRDTNIISVDGTAPATINMALTNTSVSPEVLTMAYNPFGNDKLEVNKGMILDGGLIMGTGGGFNNIENVLSLYASDTIEGQTLQAIDYTAGTANIVLRTIDPVFTNNDIAKIAYPDATAQNPVLALQGAISLDDPPNGGLPAQILINGIPQTFGGADWSTYPATQALDMATFDVDNAGAITGTSLSTGSGAIGGGAITGTSLSAGSGAITGATLTTTGLIKSSGTLQLSGNVISNASNNTTITGLNGITMAGTTPAITGVNSLAISNTNATTPLTITNSGDNPHIICNNAGASTTIPVEINLVNGSTILAYGNQGADPRGAFFFFNGRDCIRIPAGTGRVQMTYSPYSPTLATSGTAGAWVAGTGSFVSGVPKILGTQSITLGVNNLPIIAGGLGVQCFIGLNGYLNTCVLSGAGGGGGGSHYDITVSATYTRTRGGTTVGPFALYGCSYPISILSGPFFSPINGTTYNEAVVGERITFTHGDIITINIFGLYVGGSPPTITTPASGIASVFSPFFI